MGGGWCFLASVLWICDLEKVKKCLFLRIGVTLTGFSFGVISPRQRLVLDATCPPLLPAVQRGGGGHSEIDGVQMTSRAGILWICQWLLILTYGHLCLKIFPPWGSFFSHLDFVGTYSHNVSSPAFHSQHEAAYVHCCGWPRLRGCVDILMCLCGWEGVFFWQS